MPVPKRDTDQFNVRLPDGMRPAIADRARLNLRSMNSEIVSMLAQALGDEGKPTTGESFQASPVVGPNETALAGGSETQAVEQPR